MRKRLRLAMCLSFIGAILGVVAICAEVWSLISSGNKNFVEMEALEVEVASTLKKIGPEIEKILQDTKSVSQAREISAIRHKIEILEMVTPYFKLKGDAKFTQNEGKMVVSDGLFYVSNTGSYPLRLMRMEYEYRCNDKTVASLVSPAQGPVSAGDRFDLPSPNYTFEEPCSKYTITGVATVRSSLLNERVVTDNYPDLVESYKSLMERWYRYSVMFPS
ncbi:hypothetical protein [Thalassospira lucentensis]|uniref:hypothetical protein n=1 Tax=Thalassospira lucentensis TaxID=168935 RepID=UPI003AA9D957